MTHSTVAIKISTQSLPSLPPWFAEVSLFARVLTQFGMLDALQERVRCVRARFGIYETIDFLVVMLGYAISAEDSLQTFYERLQPFAIPFMALFARARLPSRSALSRFLAVFDARSLEALRTLFEQDLLARTSAPFPPGALWDRQDQRWLVIDVDGTRQPARQRALPTTCDLPQPRRRFDRVCAPGYLGRKRGEVVRTRTTVLQAHTHHWLGTFSHAGNGDYRGELDRTCQAIVRYVDAFAFPVSRTLVRLDGLYGNGVVIDQLLRSGLGCVVRGKDYQCMLDGPEVQARLLLPADDQLTHPESGMTRDLFDLPALALFVGGPKVRVIVAAHPTSSADKPAVGVLRDGTVFELFLTTAPSPAFCASDIVSLYLHRGSFETVLADEDREHETDRWCSHSPVGQECWQILNQWLWNLRSELGTHLEAQPMRQTVFALAHPEPPAPPEPEPVDPSPTVHLARPSFTKGFCGDQFPLQSDGTLRCPAGHPLSPREHRKEAHGVVRIVYCGRIAKCRPCPLRQQCQETGNSKKPRQVSLIVRPFVPPPPPAPIIPAPFSIRWDDWPRCRIRRQWMARLRSQQIDLDCGQVPPHQQKHGLSDEHPAPCSRAQRAHWRLSWQQRFERNARPLTAPPISITMHGLPASLATALGISLVA